MSAHPKLETLASLVILCCSFFVGCSRKNQHPERGVDIGPQPSVQVPLKPHGLPVDFFKSTGYTECASQIIGYRFVVWLNNQDIAVGFNTSPPCRKSPDRKVDGMLRVLVFDLQGNLKASRDFPYLADGNGELVADGEAMPGPDQTLLIRRESVNVDENGRQESRSGVHLVDKYLKDVAHLDGFLEQTTLVNHAIVFQEGYALSGPRTYSILDGPAATVITHRQVDWPTGAMDRKFGEHDIAFMYCGQELAPGSYVYTNVVHVGARFRCALNVLSASDKGWTANLVDGETAALVGVLADGSVVGKVHTYKSNAERLMRWKSDGHSETLPWVPPPMDGTVETEANNFSRYGVLAAIAAQPCNSIQRIMGAKCDEDGETRWLVFDRKSQSPLIDRTLPKNGRAALSQDGNYYASFEGNELRIFPLAH